MTLTTVLVIIDKVVTIMNKTTNQSHEIAENRRMEGEILLFLCCIFILGILKFFHNVLIICTFVMSLLSQTDAYYH